MELWEEVIRKSKQIKQDKANQEQWVQQEAAQYAQNRSVYNRAYGACLEGRGYTIK